MTRERWPEGKHDDLVARANDAGHDLARVAAEVLVGPHDALHRKPEIDEIRVARDVHRFEMRQQAERR